MALNLQLPQALLKFTVDMHFLSGLLVTAAVVVPFATALTSTLQNVTSFTTGPTAARMYVYVPTTRLKKPPIIVAIHWCTGTAQDYFMYTLYAELADTYGYIVVYPETPVEGHCWDVASIQSLTHEGGGDSQTIANMVRYAVRKYGGDRDRVYATGTSSGAMMTNVLAGAYPDIFKAGSAFSGVPDGCFYLPTAAPGDSPASWNNDCSSGQYNRTGQQWGDLTRSFFPGYRGPYPRMQIWHGTSDTGLHYLTMKETLKQWSNVLHVPFRRNVTDTPLPGYTKMIYGDGTKLVGYSALDVGHTVPVREMDDLVWFGIARQSAIKTSTTAVVTST